MPWGDERGNTGDAKGDMISPVPHPPASSEDHPAVMKQPVTVAASTFEDLVAIGLRQIISEDSNIELVADDIALEDLESVLNSLQPSVVLLNYGSLPSPAFVYQLHQGAPDTRIVVLANRPTAAE